MIMSQQTQQGGIDVFIPLAEVFRIISSNEEAKGVIADHQNLKIAILRNYVYSEEPKRSSNENNKLVLIGNPCYRVAGVIFEKMSISNVENIVYGSQQRQARPQPQGQQPDKEMIIMALEELPSYKITAAYFPLEYIYKININRAQTAQQHETRILDAIKSPRTKIKEYSKKIDELLKDLNLANLSRAIEELKKFGFANLVEHYIDSRDRQGSNS